MFVVNFGLAPLNAGTKTIKNGGGVNIFVKRKGSCVYCATCSSANHHEVQRKRNYLVLLAIPAPVIVLPFGYQVLLIHTLNFRSNQATPKSGLYKMYTRE